MTHFTQIITDIVDDKWSHLPAQWISPKKQKLYVISPTDINESRTLDQDPQPFWLGYHRLGQKLFEIRLKVVQTFRKFKFEKYTPLMQEHFPDVDLGLGNSGINELFVPPKRGRPRKADIKKRKQRDMDVEYLPSSTSSRGRNLRRRGPKRLKTGKGPVVDQSSSDSNKVLSVADILLQARDVKTGKWKVFVEWEDRSLAEASWTPLNYLSRESTQWWQLLCECRYPLLTEKMFPSLAISGPPSLVADEEGDESTASSASENDYRNI